VQRLGDINYALHHEGEALRWYEEGIAKGVASDETIFRVATLYDSPGGARDIEKAYEYYRLITEEYQSSVHFEAALQRVQFFEDYFFNYY
jgi:TPR repeat protein